MALYFSLFFLSSALGSFFCIFSTLGSFIPFLTVGATLYKNINTLLSTYNSESKVMTLYECLCQCSSMCNDQAQHAAKYE